MKVAEVHKSTIGVLDETINEIDERIAGLQKHKQAINVTKEAYCEVNNICSECLGEGYYYRQSSGGDPYERSSDLREDCPRCNGTGKYIRPEVKK
ncbi:MAG: hypothetical protein RR324_01165 [Cellulosilyticaceae bacterium]